MAWINTREPVATFNTPACRVYVRRLWSDAWTRQQWLFARSLSWCSSPATSRAVLVFDYGQVLRPGAPRFAEVAPLAIVGWWVKVEVDIPATSQAAATTRTWYGRVWESVDSGVGQLTDAVEGHPKTTQTMRQVFEARGLEAELERAYVTTSVCYSAGGAETRIGRAIGFNRARGDAREPSLATQGNCSFALGQQGAPIFNTDLATADLWTPAKIVRYLLAYHTATNSAGVAEVRWRLGGLPTGVLDLTQQPLEAHGLSVRQILNLLIDRRRVAGWRVEVSEAFAPAVAYVIVHTFASEDLVLPDGIVRANANQTQLDFATDPSLAPASLVTSYFHAVDRVRAAGARRGACFTISAADGTLVADWDNALVADYNAAASVAAGYGALSRADRERRNDLWRSDPRFERVFRYWRLPDAWDGKAGDGEGGTPYAVDPWLPVPPADFNPAAPARPRWRPGIRFEQQLPLLSDHDYSGARLATGTVVNNTPAGAQPHFLPPLVAIKAPRPEGGTEYIRLGATGDHLARIENLYDGGRGWGASVRMQPFAAGIIVDVHHGQGAGQHVLASAEFSPRPFTETLEIQADLDWQNNLLGTVFWLTDSHLEEVYPRDLDLPVGDVIREQYLDFGDDFRLDYAPPGTVIDIQDGQLVRTTSGGFIRDDRPKLRSLARIAYTWFHRPRQALELVWMRVVGYVELGDMITHVGPQATPREVNSVVTAITIDLPEGGAPRTIVQTEFAELDLGRVARTLAPLDPLRGWR